MTQSKISTTGKIREALAAALIRATKGDLSHTDGKNIIGIANQITMSMSVELRSQAKQAGMGQAITKMGHVNIGG